MEQLAQLMQVPLFGNPISSYLLAALVYLVLVLALRILERVIIQKLKSLTHGETHKRTAFFIEIIEKTAVPTLYFAAFYFALIQLVLPPALGAFLRGVWLVVFAFQATRLGVTLAIYTIEEFWMKKHKQPEKAKAFKSILNILKISIWGVAAVFVLDNLGFNVGAVVAGLGIGGVAVALAAQTILGDLFNHFVIFFDRPFEEGDAIVCDDYTGVIENIGIKSTRLRSVNGEQIVISNSNLTSSRIRNYKRMAERRVVFTFGIIYETPIEILKTLPAKIRKIVEGNDKVRFDRAHFFKFGDFSLDFEVVYFVLSADYNTYMDIQQNINFAIMEAFQREKIEFAYPTAMQYQKAIPITE